MHLLHHCHFWLPCACSLGVDISFSNEAAQRRVSWLLLLLDVPLTNAVGEFADFSCIRPSSILLDTITESIVNTCKVEF